MRRNQSESAPIEKLSLLASIASDWWWEMDADLRFSAVSDGFSKAFGALTPAAIDGHRVTLAHIDDLVHRRPFRDVETVVIDSRGVSRTVAVSGAPLIDADGTFKGYIGSGREIRPSPGKDNFRLLFVNSPLPMWVYSVETLRFLEVNDALVAKYGYSRDEFLSMTLREMRPPEDMERLTQWLQLSASDRLRVNEWRHRRKDGQVVDVDVFLREIDFNGEPARLAVIIDISARKEAERQTERIFETSQDVIHVTDGFGKFMRVSPSSQTVLGYGPEELIDRNAQDFIFAEDLELIRNEMRAARRGSVARNFQCRYIHKDGHAVTLAWMSVWSAQDRRHFFIGRDMTEHNRTEEQLRQAQKMEAVGQLTGGVAHDFNNILTVVMANAEALQEDVSRDPELLGRLGAIVAATQRAADLTRHLLAFSRKQLLRPQRTNINALVSGIGRLLGRTLGEHIEISSVLADDLWDTDIDRAQLESALLNLSINARDAMPDGGRLLIETRNAVLDEDYVALNPDALAGDYVTISVTDTGTGIPADVLARVYEPFFTTKEVGKGTGLGLSMVYGFIQQSRGHVKIHSELGRGTTINLYLARSSGEAEAAAAREKRPMPRGSERVLVVEDNAQVRAAVVDQLQGLGYSVAEAPDGTAGRAAFETMTRPYDLLLTDVAMPGPINGKILADEVAQRWPLTRIVFMSGYAEDAVGHDGLLDEGVLLLNKPFTKGDLAQILRQALDDPPLGDA